MLRLVLLIAVAGAASCNPFQAEVDAHWEAYKARFDKSYKGIEEEARRLVWEQNLNVIIRHNIEAALGKHNFRMGINHLSDMTSREVTSLLNGYKPRERGSHDSITFLPPSHVSFPDSVDWRKEGYVTPVMNQGACGSSSVFPIVGAVEGQHKRQTGQLVPLSVQNLIDCATDQGGCEGSLLTDSGYEYIMKYGIDTEASYPYEGGSGPCRYTKEGVGANITGYVDIKSGSEEDLLKAVATLGPVAVAIDASQTSFQLYIDGVYDEELCSSTNLDHGVLIVGYGTEDGRNFWIVKNSWGTSWGMEGYIKMSRNKNNQCGIATSASYPTV